MCLRGSRSKAANNAGAFHELEYVEKARSIWETHFAKTNIVHFPFFFLFYFLMRSPFKMPIRLPISFPSLAKMWQMRGYEWGRRVDFRMSSGRYVWSLMRSEKCFMIHELNFKLRRLLLLYIIIPIRLYNE